MLRELYSTRKTSWRTTTSMSASGDRNEGTRRRCASLPRCFIETTKRCRAVVSGAMSPDIRVSLPGSRGERMWSQPRAYKTFPFSHCGKFVKTARQGDSPFCMLLLNILNYLQREICAQETTTNSDKEVDICTLRNWARYV